MLKAKQAWCLFSSWLISNVLCLGDQIICFTDFDDQDPSIGVNLRVLKLLIFQIVIQRHNLFNKYFGYQHTTHYKQSKSQYTLCMFSFQHHMMSTYTISSLKIFSMWKDQDNVCCHSARNSDSQLSVDLRCNIVPRYWY